MLTPIAEAELAYRKAMDARMNGPEPDDDDDEPDFPDQDGPVFLLGAGALMDAVWAVVGDDPLTGIRQVLLPGTSMNGTPLVLGHGREDPTRTLRLRHLPGPGLQFDPAKAWLLGTGGEKDGQRAKWTVEVRPDPGGDLITRLVWCNDHRFNLCGGGRGSCTFDAYTEEPGGGRRRHDEVIWPAWPATSQDEAAAAPSPLADVQQYWSTAGNRLRDSAKWTAAVLGAALATVIGASPLAGMREQTPQPVAIVLGAVGLVLLGITMFLVLQVMRPQSVSYDRVQNAQPPRRRWLPQTPLYKWRFAIESHQDLYLPYGVRDLVGLRQSMIIEEVTLKALACTLATAGDQASRDQLCEARQARAARLRDLRSTAAMIATVGEYYLLRCRSSWATYGGVLCGLLGTAAIVTAFAWPLH